MFKLFKNKDDNKNEIDNKEKIKKHGVSSVFGEPVTSIYRASQELGHKPTEFDPLKYISSAEGKYFYGLDHLTKEPIYINKNDITHQLFVGPTRSGKGILISYFIAEAIKSGENIIVIDPKGDGWLLPVVKTCTLNLDKKIDFHLAEWPNNWILETFSEEESLEEILNKLVALLNLTEVENEAGASYYRKSERIALKKALYYFSKANDLLYQFSYIHSLYNIIIRNQRFDFLICI